MNVNVNVCVFVCQSSFVCESVNTTYYKLSSSPGIRQLQPDRHDAHITYIKARPVLEVLASDSHIPPLSVTFLYKYQPLFTLLLPSPIQQFSD